MRKRSESFYAKNDYEIEQIYNKRRNLYVRRKSRLNSINNSLNNSKQLINFNAYDDIEIDELGVNSTFQITTIDDSSEDEKEEENNLLHNIENLNLSLKQNNEKMFYENLTKCSKNVFDNKEIPIKKNATNYNIKNTSINNSIKLIRSQTFNDNSIKKFDKEKILPIINANEFLSENIDIVENTLKFLVMGASKSGKSYFISKVFEEKNKELKQYSGMLVIRKKNIKLLGNYIRLELLDTNSELSNSNMLDVYYKISDGMIMIIDNENLNSAIYIIDLLEKMKYKFNQNEKYNLLFLLIIKNNDNLNNNNKQSFEIKNIISKIENEYNYHFKYIDLKDSEKFNNIINKFFSISYLKKGWNTKLNKGKEKKNFINNVKDIRKDIRHISLLKH